MRRGARLALTLAVAFFSSPGYAWLPNLRASNLQIDFRGRQGTLAADDFFYQTKKGQSDEFDSLKAKLVAQNNKVRLEHPRLSSSLGGYFNFLTNCQTTRLQDASYRFDTAGARWHAPALIRECPNATVIIRDTAMDCDIKALNLSGARDEQGPTLLQACLNEHTRFKIGIYQNLQNNKPSWLSRPFVPKEIQDLDIQIDHNKFTVNFGLETPIVRTHARLAGLIAYTPADDILRIDIQSIRIGHISGSKLLSVVASMLDKNSVQYEHVDDVHTFKLKMSSI